MPASVSALLDYFVRRPKPGIVAGNGVGVGENVPDSIDVRFLTPLVGPEKGRAGLTWGSRALLVEAKRREANTAATGVVAAGMGGASSDSGTTASASSTPAASGSFSSATVGGGVKPPKIDAPRQLALSAREADTIVLHWLARVLAGWPPLQTRVLQTLPGVDLVCVLEACRRVAAHVVVDIPVDVPSWTRARQAEYASGLSGAVCMCSFPPRISARSKDMSDRHDVHNIMFSFHFYSRLQTF